MEDTTRPYDIFISYRHSVEGDLNTVKEIASNLRQAGLEVFVDETGVDHFDSITQTIQRDLANSKALLVHLSDDYLSSRACLWELTAAFIAAQKKGGAPRERIFVVNPTDTTEYLSKLPVELRDARYALPLESALTDLPERLRQLEGTFQDLGTLTFPTVHGRTLTGSPRFVGRLKELWEIHSCLNESGCTMVTGHVGLDIAQISGMGGIGKSLLAEEYALRFGAAYPGGVFWLDAHGSFDPDAPDVEVFKAACSDQFLKILHACGQKPPPDTPFEYLKAQIAWVIEKKGERCLWIVDDIPHGLANHLNTVKDWFAPHPSACTLVTTRSREYTSVGRELPLDVLDVTSALELFEKHGINLENQRNAATTLIEHLGRHALALDIAGATIAELNPTITQYLAELEEDIEELLDVPKEYVGTLPSGHERSIVLTMQHSISKLSETSLDFLRLAANLSPAPIRTELVEGVFTEVDGLEKIESRKRARRGVLGCEQLSLAKRTDESWQIHALISATVKHMGLAADGRGAHLRATAIKVLTALIKPELIHKEAELISLEVEHARFLTSTIQSEEELELLYRLADFDHFHGHVKLSVEDWQRLFAFNKEILGPDHPDTLTAMGNLASTLYTMGDHPAAKQLEEQVLDRFKQILGPEHPDTLTAMGNLAQTLYAMGDHPAAKRLQEQVLDRRTKILGPEHPDTLTAMGNLASTLYTMGEHPAAKQLQEQVLDRRTEILGPDHPDTTASAWNLFTTLYDMEDLSMAQQILSEHLEWLLEDTAKIQDARQRQIRDMLKRLVQGNNVASTEFADQIEHGMELMGQEDWAGAKEIWYSLLESVTSELGQHDPITTVTAWPLFICHHKLEEFDAAREVLADYLMWLTEVEETTLDSRQQQIREQVTQLTRGTSDP